MKVAIALFGIIDLILIAVAGNIMISEGHIFGSNAYYAVIILMASASIIGFIEGALLATLPKRDLLKIPEQ